MLTRERWLAERKKGIGGSEVAAILGLDKYKSPFQIWHDKTGRSTEQPDNAYMKFGRKSEALVVEYWEEETGLKAQECGHLSHSEHDFILGTPDRLYTKDGAKGVLECKTTRSLTTPYDDMRFFPYFCQLQWYMALANASVGEIAILDRVDCEFYRYEFEFNKDFYQNILEQVINFWQNHVLKDIPPEPRSNQDIEKMFRKHIDGKFIEAAPATLEAVQKLKSVKEQIKQLETQEEEIAGQIKMILRDSEYLSYQGQTLVTWKSTAEINRFDLDAFKNIHPELYNQFKKKTPGTRRFSVK